VASSPILTVCNLVKRFDQPDGTLTVLDSVNFSVLQGEACALTGESGSGKSTLFQLIAGLLRPDGGVITVRGEQISELDAADQAAFRRRHLGLVFQQFRLIMTLTVRDNVRLLALLNDCLDIDFEDYLLRSLGLTDQVSKLPAQLSGGQQQRVGIARALCHRPALVLADEPTGSLDAATSQKVSSLLIDLCREAGTTLLSATHSSRLAEAHSRRLHLDAGRLADSRT
jgi:putative ABC transport system ATP-binding protein